MKARTDQAHTVIIGEARSPVGVSLGLRLIGDEEVATVTLTQHDRTVTLYVTDQAHAAQIAAAIQGHPPLAAEAPRVEAKATAMTDYQLVPFPPTPEMVSAAEDAYMPFGDMELALRMAILTAPAVQGEREYGSTPQYINDAIDNLAHANYELSYSGYQERTRDVELIRAYVARAAQPAEQQPAPHWSGVNPGLADQYRAEALAARRSLGFDEDADDVSPANITAAVDSLRQPAPDVAALAARLSKVIRDLKSGFVACERCGDQEDTATLDCMPELTAIRNDLAAIPSTILTLLDKVEALQAEREKLRNLLRHAQPIIKAHAEASHMLEGFRPRRNQWDELVEGIHAATQEVSHDN